jgi:hypothetical protein
MSVIVQLVLLLWLAGQDAPPAAAQPAAEPHQGVVLEDFESYKVGGVPTGWKFNKGRKVVPFTAEQNSADEYFEVLEEGGNQFVRVITTGRAHRMILLNGEQYDWDLRTHPRLRWDWRALELPEGAREDRDDANDTGAAVYVTFSRDWLGRPRSIKYTYSSTLPIGTVASYGPLRVLVVASAAEKLGAWMTVERDVISDYQQLFGGTPPDQPPAITLWSDSDTVEGKAVADFDNLEILPPR